MEKKTKTKNPQLGGIDISHFYSHYHKLQVKSFVLFIPLTSNKGLKFTVSYKKI